jgi:hypothetical protein
MAVARAVPSKESRYYRAAWECLHAELLRGDRAALGIACFIGLYWTARVVVDALYFSHADWPKGREFVIGHAPADLLVLRFGSEFFAAGSIAYFAWWQALTCDGLPRRRSNWPAAGHCIDSKTWGAYTRDGQLSWLG